VTSLSPWLATSDVARALHLSPSGVHKLVAHGELQPRVVARNGFRLYHEEDVARLAVARLQPRRPRGAA
jgi:DNA-binding transcriptional MerR regulator